ncbi:MAG: thiamine biosynthesis protein ThiF, partial [Bryobacterales bacterium]|nr:thiamine biosynthesis protein ThiF [Bryobacterales bacterium]
PQFTYDSAFSRNRGWVTAAEQQVLRRKRVAIAGLGGVGGAHLLTLTRLGIGRFHISDFDDFDVPNFNRQAGAFVSSLGKPKSEVLAAMARDINPEVELTVFDEGVNAKNVDAFLDGVDLYVDGLDFFAFSARKLVFPGCAQRGIPATTAAPLGMGSAILNFVPGGMTFEEYFRWEDCSEDEMALRFLIGLSPAMLQRGYLVDKSAVDFAARKGPSTPMACEICAGMAGTQALKILLGRGKLVVAPHGLHFDAYRNKMVKTWRPGGNSNPVQRLAIWIAGKQLAQMAQASPS